MPVASDPYGASSSEGDGEEAQAATEGDGEEAVADDGGLERPSSTVLERSVDEAEGEDTQAASQVGGVEAAADACDVVLELDDVYAAPEGEGEESPSGEDAETDQDLAARLRVTVNERWSLAIRESGARRDGDGAGCSGSAAARPAGALGRGQLQGNVGGHPSGDGGWSRPESWSQQWQAFHGGWHRERTCGSSGAGASGSRAKAAGRAFALQVRGAAPRVSHSSVVSSTVH